MGIVLTAIFLALSCLSPAEMVPALAPLRIELWFAVPALFAGLVMVMRDPMPMKMPQVYLLVGLFFAVGLSRVANTSRFLGSSITAEIDFASAALPFYFVLFNSSSLRALRLITTVLIAVAVFLAVQGTVAYFLFNTQTAAVLYGYSWNPESHTLETFKRIRGNGFLSDPNDLAQFLLISLALLGIPWQKGGVRRLFLLVPGGILLTGIVLTRSRGGLLGLVAVFALMMRDRLGKVASGIGSIVLLVGLLASNFTGNREISVSGGADRLDIWREGLAMLKGAPLWGIGYQWYTHHFNYTAHNSYVLCFAELGLIGYFFWLALIIYSLSLLSATIRLEPKNDNQRDIRRWAQGTRVALYSFAVTSWFLSRTYTMTFYVLIGLCAALVSLMQRETNAPSLTPQRKLSAVTMMVEFASILLIYVTLKVRSFL